MNFNAIILNKSESVPFNACITQVSQQELKQQQDADTLIKIDYSTLNYKDALALTNSNPVVRKWPMIPGIDGVGTVIESKNNQFQIGQKVVLNSWGVGETHWGCLAQYAYLKSDWLIPLPDSISTWQAMALGTAGYTAALCVLRVIQHGVKPDAGPILVTGATGGVGSIAIALLAKKGYHVTAATGKQQEKTYLEKLGAQTIIDRQAFSLAGKALQKEQWVAAVDVSGSHTLANICAQTYYGGIVTACGLAQGLDFPASVAPFILRNITLAGIDSVMVPQQARLQAWGFLAEHLDLTLLDNIAQTISLSQSIDVAKNIMAGQIKGRFVVDVNQ